MIGRGKGRGTTSSRDPLLTSVTRLRAGVRTMRALKKGAGNDNGRLRVLDLVDECRSLLAALSEESAAVLVEIDTSRKRVEASIAYGSTSGVSRSQTSKRRRVESGK